MHTIYELCLPSERGFGMCMDLADPVSSGKYIGTFVFTAPVAEPTVMSFTVPLNGSIPSMPLQLSWLRTLRWQTCRRRLFASRCRVVVEVSLVMVLTILLGTV